MQFDKSSRPEVEVNADETTTLISSDKVEGTAVYGLQEEHLGKIHNFMVDKASGHVAYAVLSFGGFLGMGDNHYPIPWSRLRYDTRLGGYVTDLTRDQLEGAPSFSADRSPDWVDPTYGERIDSYYGTRPFI